MRCTWSCGRSLSTHWRLGRVTSGTRGRVHLALPGSSREVQMSGQHPLDLVELFLKRFVVYPSEHALVAHVLWIAHCHLMDCWETTPRLAFMSAEPGSGKTRALEVTALFVPNPKLSF